MTWKTSLTNSLKIQYPIIQAPMLGVSTPEMAAEVSNAGGLGSLPVGGLSPELTLQLIRKTKSLTNKPYAVNLFVHDLPAYKEEDLQAMKQAVLNLAADRAYKLEAKDLDNFIFYTYHDQIDILLEEQIRIISFTFGCLDPESIDRFKENGCILIGTATCLEEALFLQEQKIDMICLQGIEAGGHRGTFLQEETLPQIGLISLLSQITKQVSVPCIAAGGINNAQNIKASFDLGAAAVQVGTLFIGTDESEAIPSYKQKLQEAKDPDSALTKAFSGRWARGIRNKLMDEIEKSGLSVPPYPLQNSITAKLRKLAQQNNDAEFTNLWAGQLTIKNEFTKTKDVFLNLVKQYEAAFT